MATKSYNLSGSDALFIQEGYDGSTDVYSKYEGSKQQKIASYKAGKWKFDNNQQRDLFFKLLKQYPLRIKAAVLDYIK